jgi:PAS domain S-box-containing protein
MHDTDKSNTALRDKLAELRQSEEQYRRLIDEMSDGYVLTRRDQILFANRAMAEMLDCTVDDLVGRSWKEFIEPDVADYIDRTPMVDLPPLLQVEVSRSDGSRRTFELAVHSARYRGELAEFTLVRDITERIRLQEALQRHATTLEQQVAERTQELADANERLQDLERLKSKFITDISHELRTPLTNLRLGLHLLECGQPEKQAEYLKALQTQSGRLVRLVEDILHFSQLKLDEIKFAPVDLNGLVEQVVVAHQPQAETAGLELAFNPGTALPPVKAQARQILRMTTELVENAITYTYNGRICVNTYLSPDGDQVCLEIQDTGKGIDSQDLPHVFERFFRGRDVGSSSTPGVGLGLTTAKEIADLHGGKIEVQSELGTGSTFFVWLPVDLEFRLEANLA